MADESDILLRVTANPPLTTKNDELTHVEGDANWITIYNALFAQRQSSYVDAYDSSVTYDDTVKNYSTYDGKTWKWIHATPASNVTPGTDATRWEAVYVADLGHKKNQDQGLDEGGPNAVTAERLARQNIPFRRVVTMDELLDCFITNVEIIPVADIPEGFFADVNKASCRVLWEDSPASTPYDTNMDIELAYEGAALPLFSLNSVLAQTVPGHFKMVNGSGSVGPTDTQIISEGKPVVLRGVGGNPQNGTFEIVIYGTYDLVEL